MELSPSSIGREADLDGSVRDISGRATKGIGGLNKDSVASSSVSLQLGVGDCSPTLSEEPTLPSFSCSQGGDALLGAGDTGFLNPGSTGDVVLDGVEALLRKPCAEFVAIPGCDRVSAKDVRRTPATSSLRSATPLMLANSLE